MDEHDVLLTLETVLRVLPRARLRFQYSGPILEWGEDYENNYQGKTLEQLAQAIVRRGGL